MRDGLTSGILLVTTLLVGCGTTTSARVANGIANAAAPCPAASGYTAGGGPVGGSTSLVAVPAAIALAAAGAQPPSVRCSASVAPTPPGTRTAHASATRVAPEPERAGRFRCITPDGEEDDVVADTPGEAQAVCGELTAEACHCTER